jgi:hypothetical protein
LNEKPKLKTPLILASSNTNYVHGGIFKRFGNEQDGVDTGKNRYALARGLYSQTAASGNS